MQSAHILWITPGFPADVQDDTCIPALQRFLQYYTTRRTNIEVTVLALHYPFTRSEYDWHGVKVYALGGRNRGKLHKPFLWKSARDLVKRLHREKPFSGVHSFWLGETALLGDHFSNQLNIPHIITLMGQEVLDSKTFYKRLSQRASALVGLSPYQAGYLEAKSSIRVSQIIPWGVENIAAPAQKTIDIIGVGNLVPLKRFDLWLQTVKEVSLFLPEINTILAGEGPEYKRLQDMIQYFELQENVTLKGKVSHLETLQLIASSRMLLHTSAFEGFGYAMAEALAAGVPVVASPVGIAHQSAHIYTGNSVAEWTSSIKNVLDEKNPAIVSNPYPISYTCDQYHELYIKSGVIS